MGMPCRPAHGRSVAAAASSQDNTIALLPAAAPAEAAAPERAPQPPAAPPERALQPPAQARQGVARSWQAPAPGAAPSGGQDVLASCVGRSCVSLVLCCVAAITICSFGAVTPRDSPPSGCMPCASLTMQSRAYQAVPPMRLATDRRLSRRATRDARHAPAQAPGHAVCGRTHAGETEWARARAGVAAHPLRAEPGRRGGGRRRCAPMSVTVTTERARVLWGAAGRACRCVRVMLTTGGACNRSPGASRLDLEGKSWLDCSANGAQKLSAA